MRPWNRILLLGALLLVVTGCSVLRESDRASLRDAPEHLRDATVRMPRAWPTAVEALVAVHRQVGLKYAVVGTRFEGTVGRFNRQDRSVAPFEPGAPVPLVGKSMDLVGSVAHATDTRAYWMNGVLVFQPDIPGPYICSVERATRRAEDPRRFASDLAKRGEFSYIPHLSRLAAHEDPSVRFHALAGLQRMEGDFMRNEWPGRVSIFEVLPKQEARSSDETPPYLPFPQYLDVQALRFAMEEGGPRGGPVWRMACEVLGRARDPYLLRALWSPIANKTAGTLPIAVWAVGRSGDPTADWALRKRIRNSFTNHVEDQYLAAIAMGRLGLSSRLREMARHPNVDIRRAAVMGLGLCEPTPSVLAQLDRSLKDQDTAVQFLVCQSLARLGTTESLRRLFRIAGGTGFAPELRCAALEALERISESAAEVAATDSDPRIRAKAADCLGNLGGTAALSTLLKLIGDEDKWVRASAACALGRLGTAEAVGRVTRYMEDETTDTDGLIAAIIGLGRGHSPEAVASLAPILTDTDRPRRMRRYAVLALAQLANGAGRDALKAKATREAWGFMPFALRHLDLGNPDDTATYLADYLARGDRDTQSAAANRLAELGNGAGVRELIEGSDVFDNSARMMHMWGAIRAQGPAVVPALVVAAKSKRAVIRETAALALGGRIDADAVDALIALTEDEHSGPRSVAAQSLGLTGDPNAIPALIRLAETDENTRVYCAAIRALRMRAFSRNPDVAAAFARLAGTARDAGVINRDAPSLSEQPANSFVLRRWPASLDDDTMCNVTYESSLTYDSDRGRVVLWGSHGRRADSPQTGQTWFYDAKANTWTRLQNSREWPNGTCLDRGTTYDPANRVVVSPKSGRGGHGWVNALRANLQWSVPWVLDAKTDQWYPAKTVDHQGSLGQVPGSFDQRHGVIVWWQGKLWVYDAYANNWTRHRPTGPAPGGGSGGCAFDPETGRLIAPAGGSVWAYDPVTNKWTDLKPSGSPGPSRAPLVYDSTNHVMLAFTGGKGSDLRVWAYHLRENKWEEMPQTYPAPHYGTLDVTFDSRNNVAVISGGWQTGRSGETTVRETWTYRYKPANGDAKPTLGAPRNVRAAVQAGGKATVTWDPPAAGDVAEYHVYYGVGAQPWLANFQRTGKVTADVRTFAADGLNENQLAFYRVVAVDADGKEGPPSSPARTEPPAPRWAAAVLIDKGIDLRWAEAPDEGIAGYHVYRAPADVGDPWSRYVNPSSLARGFTRITDEPVTEAAFVDTTAKVAGPVTELAWPKTVAYIVRAVNAWGREGGPSPVAIALPDAPGPVRVIPWLDGRRLVLWSPGRVPGVRGHHIMRMDDWHRSYVFRWQPSPVVGCAFYDDFDFPTADRRRYYVSGVDRLGTVGIPSSGAWSHGFP